MWQSQVMRGRALRFGVAVVGTLFGVVGETLALQAGRAPSAALLHLAVGLTYLYGGLAIWQHEPANRTGRLMALVGLTWFIGTLDFAAPGIIQELGLAFEDTPTILVFVLVLAYPRGRLQRTIDRVAVAILAVGATAINILYSTSLAISSDTTAGLYGGLTLATMTSVVVISRWLSASRRARRDLVPVLVAGLVFLATLIINIIRRIAQVPDEVGDLLIAANALAPAAIPVALLIGFYRQSERRSNALIEAIPDRMFRFGRDGQYVSGGASAASGSDPTVPTGRRLHELTMATARATALAAAGRALDTGELQAFDFALEAPSGTRQLEARIAPSGPDEVTAIVRDFTDQRAAESELRLSRARIVEAGDEERRRLERDLHDGAQQRLVSLSLALRLLRGRLGTSDASNAETIAAADEAAAAVRLAIQELRELARGIHPAILTEAGLGPALTSLAERSAVPATVSAVPDRRLPAAVEATAYFVISEALANVGKYARATKASIGATCVGSVLRVEIGDDGVGGADSSRGTGIRGLQDRVAALGGRLTIDSPPGQGTLVVAEIPAA